MENKEKVEKIVYRKRKGLRSRKKRENNRKKRVNDKGGEVNVCVCVMPIFGRKMAKNRNFSLKN